jgi:hypothetical protein
VTNAELGGNHVEPLGDVLAHDVQLAPAAGTALVGDVDHLLDARQVRRQRAAVGAAPPCPDLARRRIFGLLAHEAFRLDLLGLLEAQKKLVDRQALGPPPEAMAV